MVCPTFAKYATNTELTNDARVAKWGVTVTMSGATNVFLPYYRSHDYTTPTQQNQATGSKNDSLTVSGKTDVVAPGTWGYMNYITFSGKPETAVDITFDLDLTLNNWKTENGEDYCPIIFKIDYGSLMTDSNGVKVNDTYIQMDETINTVAKLEKAVEDAVNAAHRMVEPNTDLGTLTGASNSLRILWAWPFNKENPGFESTNHFKTIDPGITDAAKDTHLCNLAADGDTENDAKIGFAISCTISQID